MSVLQAGNIWTALTFWAKLNTVMYYYEPPRRQTLFETGSCSWKRLRLQSRMHTDRWWRLTHTPLPEEPPVCVACNTTITVKHVLLEGSDSAEAGKKYQEERSLYSLFRNLNPEKNVDKLKEIGVFCKVWDVLKKISCKEIFRLWFRNIVVQ